MKRQCVVFLALALVGAAVAPSQGRDLSSMSGEEIKVLQQRLTDAGCYAGAIDGATGDALEAAKKACPNQEPILRIETGMHVAPIRRIGVDAQCRLAATGSDDKTVRLWSMPDGRLIRTQRMPVGEGAGGEVFAVAVSPDGGLVAAGGWDAHSDLDDTHGVYLFDSTSGDSMRRIGAFDGVILHLAFSPDGRRIAVALGGKSGVRVIDVETGAELMADRDFSDQSHSVAFGPDGALYALGWDGYLRRYDAALRRTAKVRASGGKQPYSIAVNPDGRRLAVGYFDASPVDLFDARDLRALGSADVAGVDTGSLASVAWSRDGASLYAAGLYQKITNGAWRRLVRAWTVDGRRLGADAPVAENTILNLAPCGDAIAFAAFDPVFGLLPPSGVAVTLGATHSADMRGKLGASFMTSQDATRVRFGLRYQAGTPVLFDLSAAALTDAPTAPSDLFAAQIDGLNIKGWQDLTNPTLAGAPLALLNYERARSLAIRADRSGFTLGTEWRLREFNAAGKQKWEKLVPGASWGVNLARNDSVIVAAYGDGTIRWHRASDGQELLALFVDATDRRWVAWTPSGYYMASAGGEDLIGWQVNRGWEQQADFFPGSRFRERFNRPDIVRLVLDTLDEDEAVKRANQTAKRSVDNSPLTAKLPPVVTILSPALGGHFSGGEVTLEYTVRSPSGLAVDRVETLIDGQSAQSRGFERVSGEVGEKHSLTLALPAHDVEIGLLARSGALAGDIARVKLIYDGAKPAAADLLKPKLYALVVGVSQYADPAMTLKYAADDAKGFAAALNAQKGGLYSDVSVKLVTDADATSLGVKKGLVWLRQQTTSRDLSVVYLAGHGVTDAKGRFWFLSEDADMSSLLTSAVSRDELVDVLYDLPGKKALFLDACHAGAALNAGARGAQTDLNSAVNDFATADSGLVAFAASTGREFSIEREEWGHGAFTKALIEAIGEGKATIGSTHEITTASLDAYLSQRVKELTNGAQHPVMTRPQVVPDFPLAVAR